MGRDYSLEDVKRKVKICIIILFENDRFLFEVECHERTISHKLAEYLQIVFPEWNVDCEYNRMEFDSKRMHVIEDCSKRKKKGEESLVFPDIIIHRRNTKDNLLVIEIKKNDDSVCDAEKLKEFTDSNGDFSYKWGLFINFKSTREPELKWFKDKEQMNGKDDSTPR